MSKIKYIFLFIISLFLWAIFWTNAIIFVFFVIFISFLLPKKMYNPIIQILCLYFHSCVFIFPRMQGTKPEKLPNPVIYVCNHVSFFDLFVCGAKLPLYPRGLEMSEHFKYPVYGWFIRRFDMIPVDLKSTGSIRKSLYFAAEILRKKIRSILIMPEGMRTRTGQILPFKNGAFYLARISGCPIVPVVNRGLFRLNNPSRYIIKPGRFDMVLLPPVYARDFCSDLEMMNHVRQIMKKELQK